MQFRIEHELHQTHSDTIQIDEHLVAVGVHHRFAGVLFELDLFEFHFLRVGRTERNGDDEFELAVSSDRVALLSDLIALRHVRVEVVLAIERAELADLTAEREAGLDRQSNGLLVQNGQRTGERTVEVRDVRIGHRLVIVAGEREQL